MVELLDPPVIAPPKRKPINLILHCGAHAVNLDEVKSVQTPRATSTWSPIPHRQLIDTVQRTLKSTSLRIGTQAHSLTHDGMRYFGPHGNPLPEKQ